MVEDALEDVDLIMNLSGGYHVEDLQPYKEIEYKGHMARTVAIHVLQVYDFLVELISIHRVESTREDHIVFFHAYQRSILRVTKLGVRLRNQVLSTNKEDKEKSKLE